MLNPFDLKQSSSTWSQIVNLKDDLNSIGIDLPFLFKKKIGNGKSTIFWHDNWLGGKTLHEAFMLSYQLETKKDCYVFERHGFVIQNSHTSQGSIQVLGPISQPIISRINDGLTNLHLSVDQDSWEFTQGSMRIFSVNFMRKTISNTSVDPTSQQTRWNKLLPSKVNILAWLIANKRLSTKDNLDKCGIDLDSVLCPMCNNDIKTESHILVSCPADKAVWKDIFTWWKLLNSYLSALEDVFSLANRATLEKRLTSFFDVTVNTTMWEVQEWNSKKDVENMKMATGLYSHGFENDHFF
nr:RNA-directed DNA polymerase, eukaryota, reverse transcriptase zinc-binding domain protein [Tanacetum cinerariifolium]